MPVKLSSTGGGSVTLTTPSTASDFTVTIPAATGTMVTTTSASTIEFAAGTVSAPSITTTGDTNTGIFFPAADTIAFTEGGVESMRINSSGNVGIGTSSPSEKLVVGSGGNLLLAGASTGDQSIRVGSGRSGNGYSYIDLQGDTTYSNGLRLIRTNSGANAPSNIEHRGTGALQIVTQEAAPITFFTSATERMRIDSSGNLSVGTTAAPGRFNVSWDPNGQQGIATRSISETYSGAAILFFNSTGGQAGNIFQATSSVSYNTSSDYRMKENVAPLNSGLATIAALKPISYDWIIDKSKGEGFIAHELAEHIPLAVTGEKDAINKDGSIKSQGVDYSKIVVHLVAAMQELKADNDALKERIAALEAK